MATLTLVDRIRSQFRTDEPAPVLIGIATRRRKQFGDDRRITVEAGAPADVEFHAGSPAPDVP